MLGRIWSDVAPDAPIGLPTDPRRP
jgi:hypothetical protein